MRAILRDYAMAKPRAMRETNAGFRPIGRDPASVYWCVASGRCALPADVARPAAVQSPGEMASTGHSPTHAPQSVQRSGSIT